MKYGKCDMCNGQGVMDFITGFGRHTCPKCKGTGKMDMCPTCEEEIKGFGSLSRRDNKTVICDDCGTREAFEDFRAAKG